MTNKMAKKAMGLKGFMNSMSKPKMKKGGFPDLNKDGEITKADILMGRGVINKPKAQKGMETKPTADSTFFYGNKEYIAKLKGLTAKSKPEMDKQFKIQDQANADRRRQTLKGKPGYDKNGYPITKPKAQMGMNIKKETLKNATPSIPNSYYKMGGMKEENPLSGMLKESMKEKAMAKKKAMAKSMPKPKKKMGMGGGPPNAFGIGIQPLMATKKDKLMGQSLKKGGMIKKKK